METKLENARQGLEERQRENDRAAARVLECEKRVGDETRPAEEIQTRIRAIRDALEKREEALTAAQQADQTARRPTERWPLSAARKLKSSAAP